MIKKISPLPNHIAFIMDGNGRWAKKRNLPRKAGHRAGTQNILSLLKTLGKYGIKYATLYSFSTENWNRPEEEIQGILDILGKSIKKELPKLHKNGVKVRHIGHLENLPPQTREAISNAIELTKNNTTMTLNLAFDYGGRAEIVDAAKKIITENIPIENIDEKLFGSYLYTNSLPEVDMVIRTGGDLRISNFLLWQSAYAEFYFTDVLWPDFDEKEIEKALISFSQRERRFGGI
ncbi:MAG TPA: isoprenyl transferase [Dehalococcoidia bacterium]|nr:isoprenyl transferase [Dehalococcoidia bacterium]